jgi:hypothetical protein
MRGGMQIRLSRCDMTIDRFPLWVALSLLGYSPMSEAADEVLPPNAKQTPAAVTPQEEVAKAPELAILTWVSDQDLPIFDFEQVPSVLKDAKGHSFTGSRGLAVSTGVKREAKKDREIQHYARLFRIWTFEAFQQDNQEYRLRVTTANNMLRVWEHEGCDDAVRDELKNWFHQAALASAANKPLPECTFLNQELLAQAAQGIEFTANGGSKAAMAFARAMTQGSLNWMAPRGMIGTALTMPLPFDLPDPAAIAGGAEPNSDKDNSETVIDQAQEPVADLDIAPVVEPNSSPATNVIAIPKVDESAMPTLSP